MSGSGRARFAGPARDRLSYRMMSAPQKPLSALISQILVAYTVELDCEFERRMLQTQSRSARLSLLIWLNMLRFLADDRFRPEPSLRARSQARLAPQPGSVASNDGA